METPRLFDATEDDEPTLTVTQLNRGARDAVQRAFGAKVWVRGEIHRITRASSGHAYFELVEKDEVRNRVQARVRVALFRDERAKVERRLAKVGLELADDIELRISAKPGVYVERGEFQLVMDDVDPTFTVGKLAAERERLLKALAAERLLRANAAHDIPLVPLRIGLISSGGTAAYHDFVEELAASGFAWEVLHADVRVQGNVAAKRIARAIRKMTALEMDVVVLVRGGGSRTDLAPYDSEPLARAIASADVPVMTGIGHETDRSVADEVAHTAHKTPTAVARALVERVSDYARRVEVLAQELARASRAAVASEQDHLLDVARRAGRGARQACMIGEHEVVDRAARVTRAASAAPGRAMRRLSTQAERAPRAAVTRLRGAEGRLGDRVGRIVRAAPRPPVAGGERLDGLEARLRALDPKRVLERGYTITRGENGRAVRSAAQVRDGGVLVTEFTDGETRSRVELSERREAGTPPSSERGPSGPPPEAAGADS